MARTRFQTRSPRSSCPARPRAGSPKAPPACACGGPAAAFPPWRDLAEREAEGGPAAHRPAAGPGPRAARRGPARPQPLPRDVPQCSGTVALGCELVWQLLLSS